MYAVTLERSCGEGRSWFAFYKYPDSKTIAADHLLIYDSSIRALILDLIERYSEAKELVSNTILILTKAENYGPQK